ncbi:sulfatase [Jiulongibacter sediminis]|jgi:arylsulfatase A-like enzyme|uniref:sulfatase family protein n=1 Tax=Jiulongibacter sediminis TaxID=1605367 RepID=UPI0026E96BE2|nr:sulfatase [Jiulongibacter sediminis]
MKSIRQALVLFLLAFAFFSFNQSEKPNSSEKPPNILWLVAEDLSPYIAAFGDSTVSTPNLDWLASEGVVYENVFSPSPVCAPSRSALATGMYPTQMGANHMRTGPWFMWPLPPAAEKMFEQQEKDGARFYEAIPAPEVKMFTEYLRNAGYYCTNNSKEDYQFRRTLTAWDECSPQAHWKNRKEGQPFFAMKTFMVTHESQIWAKAKDSLWVDEDLEVPVPPYLPNTEVAKKDIRRMYSNIKEMDAQVGEMIQELKDAGELENTIIVWFTDHGGPLPRQKRLIYDSGLQVPMIIRYPSKEKAGTREDRLISFVDFVPTAMSMVGIEPPAYMNGKAFAGSYEAKEREYIYAASDRYDESTDALRAVRDNRYLYVRNFKPELPRFLHVSYRDQMPIMQELYRLRDEGKLTPEQALWFAETKPEEELYDTWNDPHQLHDIAGEAALQAKKTEFKKALESWISSTNDLNLIPEDSLLTKIWPEGHKPQTATPEIKKVAKADGSGSQFIVTCSTPGASLAYKIVERGGNPDNQHWNIYHKPVDAVPGKEFVVVAHRIGYNPIEIRHE